MKVIVVGYGSTGKELVKAVKVRYKFSVGGGGEMLLSFILDEIHLKLN